MVRFEDGPETDATAVVPATIEEVWTDIADPRLPIATSMELQRVELVTEGELAVGSRFRGYNRRGDNTWDTVSTVETWEPPRRWSWVVGDPDDAVARWGFELEEDGGGTRVRQWCRMGPGRSGLTWAIKQRPDAEERIIDDRLTALRTSMQATLDALVATHRDRRG